MAKFRKKPVVIEAVQWQGHNVDEVGNFMGSLVIGINKLSAAGVTEGSVLIDTLEGTMTASPGDWIIKGVQGEFYPCKPDIFGQTYEEVENENGEG